MSGHSACPVSELLPEFSRTVSRFYDLNDAGATPGLSERDYRRLKAAEYVAHDRMRALEGLIMKSVARSELGLSLQIIIGHAELTTLHAWTLSGGEAPDPADEAQERLSGLLSSMLSGRDLSSIPSLIREIYLGSAYGDDWVPDGAGGAPAWPMPGLPRPDMAAAS